MFTAIPASVSGLKVENRYDDPAMWGARYTEFQGGAVGTGIAVGDVDGDGLVDLYVVNKTGPNQLFQGLHGIVWLTGEWTQGAMSSLPQKKRRRGFWCGSFRSDESHGRRP